ncbi:SH3 domain-containing protein [Ditylenchus destructor]|uniref:SH3 domain-containing protein n=1 Tax=Ditylenchus destructor TaxID=166010 RepID=A0AAD4R775_9BILA|nr:SH3 domain-containing protein [Ditylenchus destructor]
MNTANPWIVTQQEYQQNEGQFVLLQPVQGLISGDQSRPFFLKSGLPPGVLAQIWQLSDLNKDGKLDRLEFSIAMRLIRNCLSGMSLPATLPDSMKQIAGAPPMPQPSAMMMNHTTLPQIPNRPTSTYGSLPATPTIGMYNTLPAGYSSTMAPVVPTSSTPFMMGIKEISDWTIPQQMKLRFSQHFNQLDRNRVGVLTGVQARGVLGESGLPTNILAQIWNMSDVNKDGCLSIEKFCIAMYLIEMVKAGYALPSSLPPELNSFCNRNKRRDNLDKGQAELERRRQILREEEDRRRAEIERKEREEAERRERERQELERRREAEREAERQIELEREKERAAEEERLKAEREEARKRLEQERIKELEKIRIRDMENQRQSEIEKTTQIQQRHKTMTFQLQALDEKSQRLNNEITEARDEIINITSEIEKMRESRDQKLARITELQTRSRQSAVQCERLSHENLQLQSDCQKTFSRTQQIENLKKLIAERNELTSSIDSEAENTKVRLATQAKLVNEKRVDFDSGKEKLQKILDTYNKLVDQFSTIKQQAEEKRRTQSITEQITETPFAIQPAQTQAQATVVKRQDSSQLYQLPPDATAFGSPETKPATSNGGPINATPSASGTILVKYRALFEFVARSDDELSLQPGDVILVFEGHASEPGWLAGQIKDKVGWFPASFAEPANAAPKKPATASITTSPSTEPLESIKEEPAEKEFAADFSNAFSNNKEVGKNTTQAVNKTSNGPIAAPNATATSALYDAPPGSIDEPVSATVVAKNPEPTITKSVSNSDSIRNGNGMSNVICAGTALYQWKARNDSELSFSRGDVIEVVEQAEMRWRGRLQKKPETEGWFPKSYIKVSTAESAPSKPNNAPTSQKSVESTTNTGAVATSLQSPTAETVNLAHKRNSTTSGTTEGGDWYIALYQFDALEPTDLSLRIGDRILVIEAKDEWWKGTCNGKTGIFPANYVQKASVSLAGGENMGRAVASFEATAANQISLRAGDLVRIHNTSPGGWWEGEVERDGVKHTGWFPGNYVQVLPGDNQPPSGSTKIATAAFDYDAQHADELSFKAGDVIEVADHSDNEWWRGRKQGAPAGTEPLLFPSNFVQLRTVTPSSNRANNTLPRTNHGDLSHNGVARNPSDVHATNDRLSKQTKVF